MLQGLHELLSAKLQTKQEQEKKENEAEIGGLNLDAIDGAGGTVSVISWVIAWFLISIALLYCTRTS